MPTHAEIVVLHAADYAAGAKRDRSRILDDVVAATGWSRDNARRRLTSAGPGGVNHEPSTSARAPRQRAPKYSDDALAMLGAVWNASGGQCGKYLAASMGTLLEGLERHGELVVGVDGYTSEVRQELLDMSAASIDRYLAPARAMERTGDRPGPRGTLSLRTAFKARRFPEDSVEPGFFQGEIVVHSGSVGQGAANLTLSVTDAFTGWVFTRTMCGGVPAVVRRALQGVVKGVPFEIIGLDVAVEPLPIESALAAWVEERGIAGAPGRTVVRARGVAERSSHNQHIHRYGFIPRCEDREQVGMLNELWQLANDQLNYLTPTRRPVGWGADRKGRRKRLYDEPATPMDRLLAAGVISRRQQAELATYRDTLNPAALARRLRELQAEVADMAGHERADCTRVG